MSSTNIYGMTSRSERYFPEAFRPIQDKYWREIPEEERHTFLKIQVSAMMKLNFRSFFDKEKKTTAADKSYDEASSRRAQAIRRRLKRKPRNYQERKKLEEIRRKQPLARRYIERTMGAFAQSAFVKSSPLEMAVLVEGLVKRMNQRPEPKPKRLKLKRPSYATHEPAKGEATLPVIMTKGVPQVGINRWNNSFGLQSTAVSKYPEAYRDVSSIFWRKLTAQQQKQITLVQAQAMEKVGFEQGTEKQFIQDFDPREENRYGLDPGQATSEQEVGSFRSLYDQENNNDYDFDDDSISLQNRYSNQEFVANDPRYDGIAPAKPLNLPLGIVLLIVGMALLVAGLANGMAVSILLPGLICACAGGGLMMPLVKL